MVALEGRFVLVAAARPPLFIKPPPDEISLEMDHDTQIQRRRTSPHSSRDWRWGHQRKDYARVGRTKGKLWVQWRDKTRNIGEKSARVR